MGTTTEHLRICPLCEAMCQLRIPVTDGKVGTIRADREDPWSEGHLCPKGTTLGHLHEDPDRLRRPLVKGPDGQHREVSWEEAYAEVERVLRPVLDEHGPGALSVYVGNPTAHNLSIGTYLGALIGMGQAVGIAPIYSAGTVDQWPMNVVAAVLFGGMWSIPIPDVDRTDHLLLLGANPSASQGSLLAAPNLMDRLRAIGERGGTLTVVDPRRTATAATGEWVPIRPGTDALLLFALLRTLGEEGLPAAPHLDGLVEGLDEVLALAQPFTPERVAGATGIDAATIRRLATELLAAERPVVYGRIGTCTQEFGTLASWLIVVLNVALGALDRPGGSLFPRSALWSPLTIKPPDQTGPGWEFGRFRSRVRGAPEVLGQFPVSCLAEEIDTPGEGQVRALITVAGNPVISAPGSARLDAALDGLDAMISLDNWLNETTRHAHVVLPGQSALESAHHDDLLWMFAAGSAVRWSDPVLPPAEPRPAEWELLLRLAGTILGTPCPEVDTAVLDELYTGGMLATVAAMPGSVLDGRDADAVLAALDGVGPERLIDLGIRLGPWGDGVGTREGLTLAEVRRHPRGLVLGGLEGGRLRDILETPSGKVELVHQQLTADVPRLVQRLERDEPRLVLTSRRHLRSNNSWMHNVEVLVKGRDRCTLLMHPEDAADAGVGAGETAKVSTEAGTVLVPVEVSDEMMRGVVSLPHGWGHDKSDARLSVARRHAGVNSNLLNPGELVDVPSGNAVVNGVPVEVTPA